jgi:hypothetical protein
MTFNNSPKKRRNAYGDSEHREGGSKGCDASRMACRKKGPFAQRKGHDRYDEGYVVDANAQYVQPAVVKADCCEGEHGKP